MRRCVLFALPLVLVAAPPSVILLLSGESFVNIDRVIDRCGQQKFLVGFSWNEQNYGYLKFRRLQTLPRMNVVSLGSSRVLGFRSEMFSSSFYNAGYTVTRIGDFEEFLRRLPDSQLPDVLLIGLDQWMFNPQFNHDAAATSPDLWTRNDSGNIHQGLRTIPEVYKGLFRGELSIGHLFAGERDGVVPVGLNAVVNGIGFRNDGSFHYGIQVRRLLNDDSAARDADFAETLGRVTRGANRFNFGDRPDTDAITALRSLGAYCADKGIKVVAFLPPFADAVYSAMLTDGQHDYLRKLEPMLLRELADTGIELHAFSSMHQCGAADDEAVDGFHAGELVYVRMLLQMSAAGSVIGEHLDDAGLQRALKRPVNRYVAFSESP